MTGTSTSKEPSAEEDSPRPFRSSSEKCWAEWTIARLEKRVGASSARAWSREESGPFAPAASRSVGAALATTIEGIAGGVAHRAHARMREPRTPNRRNAEPRGRSCLRAIATSRDDFRHAEDRDERGGERRASLALR